MRVSQNVNSRWEINFYVKIKTASMFWGNFRFFIDTPKIEICKIFRIEMVKKALKTDLFADFYNFSMLVPSHFLHGSFFFALINHISAGGQNLNKMFLRRDTVLCMCVCVCVCVCVYLFSCPSQMLYLTRSIKPLFQYPMIFKIPIFTAPP